MLLLLYIPQTLLNFDNLRGFVQKSPRDMRKSTRHTPGTLSLLTFTASLPKQRQAQLDRQRLFGGPRNSFDHSAIKRVLIGHQNRVAGVARKAGHTNIGHVDFLSMDSLHGLCR
jgi:hypothetical protein